MKRDIPAKLQSNLGLICMSNRHTTPLLPAASSSMCNPRASNPCPHVTTNTATPHKASISTLPPAAAAPAQPEQLTAQCASFLEATSRAEDRPGLQQPIPADEPLQECLRASEKPIPKMLWCTGTYIAPHPGIQACIVPPQWRPPSGPRHAGALLTQRNHRYYKRALPKPPPHIACRAESLQCNPSLARKRRTGAKQLLLIC
jgi:hypothetical protein